MMLIKNKVSNRNKQLVILTILLVCFNLIISNKKFKSNLKSTSKNKLKTNNNTNNLKSNLRSKNKQIQPINRLIYEPDLQVSALGPYGMHGDVTTKYRMQDGYLVKADDVSMLPPEYFAIRDKLLYQNASRISARPIEIGDNDGNWIAI